MEPSNILVEVDFVQLEICVAAFLSQDPVLIKELNDGTDFHSDNQKRLGLPTRLVAKTFVFRLLYGGSAYSYANDPDFTFVSSKTSFWQSTIDTFYDKYKGISKWHQSLIKEVTDKGYYDSPMGRRYGFSKNSYGELPVTDIKNYIVQGMGADLMGLARTTLSHRTESYSVCRGSVHDSILFEIRKEQIDDLVEAIKDTWRTLPKVLQDRFGLIFPIPCKVEIKKGVTWGNMEVIYKG